MQVADTKSIDAGFVVDVFYRKGLKALEDGMTVKNYHQRMTQIERYKQIHKNRI